MYTGCIQQVYQYETLKVRQSNILGEVTKENNPKDLSSISSLLFFPLHQNSCSLSKTWFSVVDPFKKQVK